VFGETAYYYEPYKFCWVFDDGSGSPSAYAWQIGLFYGPLVVSNVSSLFTFAFALQFIRSVHNTAARDGHAADSHARLVSAYYRLALQLCVLFVIYTPCAVFFFLSDVHGVDLPLGETITDVFWRSGAVSCSS
jgi:hypothetical protein